MTTGLNPKALWYGINTFAGIDYAQYTPEWTQFVEQYTSDKAYEEDVMMSSMSQARRKQEGANIEFDYLRALYTKRYTHVAWALGYIVTHEEIKDNLYAQLATQRTRELNNAAHRTKEIVCANILNNFATGTGADGVSLGSASHPIEGGLTVSNIPTTSAGLSEASLEQAVIDIEGFKDNRGNLMMCKVRKLIIPKELQFKAQRILKNAGNQADTAERNINAMYQMGSYPEGYMTAHYLTSTRAWFVMTSAQKGIRYFEREAPIFESDNDFHNKNSLNSYYERYSVDYTEFRKFYCSAGA